MNLSWAGADGGSSRQDCGEAHCGQAKREGDKISRGNYLARDALSKATSAETRHHVQVARVQPPIRVSGPWRLLSCQHAATHLPAPPAFVLRCLHTPHLCVHQGCLGATTAKGSCCNTPCGLQSGNYSVSDSSEKRSVHRACGESTGVPAAGHPHPYNGLWEVT